ncbi:hypothetical protein FisN_34Hu040 [Fistulifera solaris]|uniref:Uncharacterized protein n=1 Tax=Fistulifera solaris TaxID=1519565 RepID=A0A1Z5JBA5_FISSO|nr:hypothetical protein FisN_34Hu040 [Fistulifera solaris]|eukprot:GAX11239.1 hypothetical protein FisN_34Hu040 [Fistulifera solaris]
MATRSPATAIIILLSVCVFFLAWTSMFQVCLCVTPDLKLSNEVAGSTKVVADTLSAENDKDQLTVGDVEERHSFSVSKSPIDMNCPRFATMKHTGNAGLGHKLTEVIFGMIIAEETNSTFLLDDTIWNHVGNHGSYDWLMNFLPLNETEFTMSEFARISKDNPIPTVLDRWDGLVDQSKNESNACNVLFMTYLHWCCDSANICYCTTQQARIGTFDRVKWRMQEAFSRSKYVPSLSLLDLGKLPKHEPILTIVWHVRQGDIVLNAQKEHFDNLSSQITSVLSIGKIPVHVFIYGEGEVFEKFPFLPDLCQQYFGGNCSYPTLDVRDSLYYMTESDVLITSGSSFPIIAAVLRTGGVVLYEYPKENVLGIYELADHGIIDRDGMITTPSMKDLQYRFQLIFNQKMKKLRNS